MVLHGEKRGGAVNWKHVKHFLLLLLLGVNILLGYFVYTNFNGAFFTDTQTAARTASILQKDGIRVSEELLAARNDTADTLSTPYSREEYLLSVAALLLGKEADGIYLLPSGIRAETSEGDSVFLGNDLSIAFTADGVTADLSAAVSMTEEEKKTALPAFATALLLAEKDIEGATLQKCGDLKLLTLAQTEHSLPLAGCVCTFGMAGDRIVYAEGRHFFGIPTEKSEAPLLNRVNILLKERDRGVQGEVTDISLCYALYEEADAAKLHFLPAYRIEYSDKNVSLVGAIDGIPIE